MPANTPTPDTDAWPAFMRPTVLRPYLGGIARSTLHKIYTEDSTFPRKVRLTDKTIGWRKADIDAWLERKAKGARL